LTKILSRAGVSLADVYDVEGSIAGIEELESREVSLVHELGGTIFSERAGAQILRATTGDILQSVAWDVLVPGLTAVPMRILGVVVTSDNGARVRRAQVSIRNLAAIAGGRDFPIFCWADDTDTVVSIRWVNDGAAAGSESFLRQADHGPAAPNLIFGSDARRITPGIAFRGSALAFGAGTVEVIVEVYVAWAEVGGGVSSHGLPIPSW